LIAERELSCDCGCDAVTVKFNANLIRFGVDKKF